MQQTRWKPDWRKCKRKNSKTPLGEGEEISKFKTFLNAFNELQHKEKFIMRKFMQFTQQIFLQLLNSA